MQAENFCMRGGRGGESRIPSSGVQLRFGGLHDVMPTHPHLVASKTLFLSSARLFFFIGAGGGGGGGGGGVPQHTSLQHDNILHLSEHLQCNIDIRNLHVLFRNNKPFFLRYSPWYFA